MAVYEGRAAEYFPPLSRPLDGNLSTSRRNDPQTLRRRQREDVSILRRGAIRRPDHARPLYVLTNNGAVRAGTGRPQTPAVPDDADESNPHETQPSAVGILGSGLTTVAWWAVHKPELGNDMVVRRPKTPGSSWPAPPGCRNLFGRLSRFISGLWS